MSNSVSSVKCTLGWRWRVGKEDVKLSEDQYSADSEGFLVLVLTTAASDW